MHSIAKLLFEVLVAAYCGVSRNSLFKIHSCGICTAFVSRKSLILFFLPFFFAFSSPIFTFGYHIVHFLYPSASKNLSL